MQIKQKEINAKGTRFSVEENNNEIGRAYLYLLQNDLHKEPFGFIEDVFVEETQRGKGIGTKLLEKVIEEAKKRDCYKLICTSRHVKPKVHELYKKLGFVEHGLEFRMNFNSKE